jgi:ribosome assembly protein 1
LHSILIRNPEKVTKIVAALNLKLQPRDLHSKNTRHLLNLIFSQWLPLAACTVQAVIDVVPSPIVAQRTRLPKIVYPDLLDETTEPKNKLESELWSCSATDDSSVVAYVSKMFAVQRKHMPEFKLKSRRDQINAAQQNGDGAAEETADEEEVLLGFARLYSGKLRAGSRVAVILPKYDTQKSPSNTRNSKYISLVTIRGLYTMMGRDLIPAEEIVAGNVFAVTGLEGCVGRSATLCAPSASGISAETALGDAFESSLEKECIINLGGINAHVCMGLDDFLVLRRSTDCSDC